MNRVLYLVIGVCVCGRILEGVGAFCLPFVVLKENKDFLKQVEEWEEEEAERERQKPILVNTSFVARPATTDNSFSDTIILSNEGGARHESRRMQRQ